MGSKLFVIGNGFDLHHGIPSRFSDFGRSVAASDPDVVRLIDEYLFVDEDFWSCFEARLATFDADNVIDYAEQFLVSYGAEDWSDAFHHDFEYEIEQVVDGLSRRLHTRFAKWIRSLPIPDAGAVPLVQCVDPAARFLSFNYTPTLQRLYGVPDRNVLHIHGHSSDPDDGIVLGHGWERTAEDMLAREVNEDTDTRVAGGYRLIDEYFADTFKPTEHIVERYRAEFDSLGDVTEVIVLGHSLADVDAPYFREVIARTRASTTWTVSCYLEPSAEMERLEALGVPLHLARFAPLSAM